MENAKNVILVAPARSGSTLACILLNKAPRVVALDEPFARGELEGLSRKSFVSLVERRFQEQRAMILDCGKAHSTQRSDALVGHYEESPDAPGLRRRQVDFGMISVDSSGRDFKLVFKHTIPFTGILDELRERYATYALVRNPLAVLTSWNTIDAAYRRGEVQSYAARLTEGLDDRLNRHDNALDRQVALLEWHFEQYLPLLPDAVLRYEDMIGSGGRALSLVARPAEALREPLTSRNGNKAYDHKLLNTLAEKLMATDGAIWAFYDREDLAPFIS